MGNDGNDQKGGSLWCKALLGIKGTREKYGGDGNDGAAAMVSCFFFLLKRYMGSIVYHKGQGGRVGSFPFLLLSAVERSEVVINFACFIACLHYSSLYHKGRRRARIKGIQYALENLSSPYRWLLDALTTVPI